MGEELPDWRDQITPVEEITPGMTARHDQNVAHVNDYLDSLVNTMCEHRAWHMDNGTTHDVACGSPEFMSLLLSLDRIHATMVLQMAVNRIVDMIDPQRPGDPQRRAKAVDVLSALVSKALGDHDGNDSVADAAVDAFAVLGVSATEIEASADRLLDTIREVGGDDD